MASSTMTIVSSVLFIVTFAVLIAGVPGDHHTGRYCAVRGCCNVTGATVISDAVAKTGFLRNDKCHAPFPTSNPTTLCYCDGFCQRNDPDCCPDFYEVCLGRKPPPDVLESRKIDEVELLCCHDDREYQVGEVLRINCNTCTCKPVLYEFATFVCEKRDCAINQEAVDEINDGNFGWSAGNQTEFWGSSKDDVMHYRLGTMKPTAAVLNMHQIQNDMPPEDIPEEFDARLHWPGLIEGVQNQGNCASSWAMSTAATASDRLAIQSNGTFKYMHLSPQHLLSCNVKRQQGCTGGHLDRAWWYMRKRGIVTEDCYPYLSGMTSDMQMRKGNCYIKGRDRVPPYCPNPTVRSQRYMSTPPYRIAQDETQIKAEIFTNGPVQAVFNVKSDFFMYNGGVYRHIPMKSTASASNVVFTGDQTDVQGDGVFEEEQGGWHSVRILGWGVDRSYPNRPLKYWLCANSWGTGWGEDGLFRVIRGENECSIEKFVVGVWANIDTDMMNPMKTNNVI
ncbi:uncharacterized peptidase C1-like protein F26E4.3 [Lytechinus variegatus]|uniref:uncharacterized peptidase C1-like protein F26E4.3 n=1 Tax=Lytechinus variegatus TaxID=7654 RepID=UPI001BB104D7|nr:uncharacterized peptidase C1-like protein F26E4.3 [Lytechinus variegatus]XP_041484087.1 uncharacterized peptidase C1-like protein F26E4.3 [Lytechinus variegatus]